MSRCWPRLAILASALVAIGATARGASVTPAATPLFDSATPEGTSFLTAGKGRLLGARETSAGRFSLLELHPGGPSRFVRSVVSLQRVTVGTDRAGRAVAVATSCRALCHLTAIDLTTGRVRSIRRTTSATVGVMDRGHVVFVREGQAGTADLLVDLPDDGGPGRVTRTTALARADANYDAARGSVEVTGLALHAGTLAVVLEYDTLSNGGSAVQLRRGGRWTLLARSGYGEASGIARVFQGVSLDDRGVRSFYDGGDNDAGYVARWSLSGKLAKRIPTKPFGVVNEVWNAAIDGDYLVTVPARSLECENRESGDPACTPRRYGPLGLG